MTQQKKGIIFIFLSVLLYSIMPVLIRLLGKGNIPPVTQVFLRYTVACAAAAAYFVATKSTYRVAKKDWLLLFVVALFGYALVNVFYTFANLNTQIGTVMFLFNVSTVMGPLFGYLFLGEPLTRPKIMAMGIGFVSLFFLFQPGPFATWKTGAVFALLSAVGSTLYVIGRKKLGQYDSKLILLTNTVVGVFVVGALSFLLEGSFYTNGIGTVTPFTWFITVLFGLDNFTAYYCMTRGFQLVSAGTGSMVMLTENFIAILFAFLFFAEIPTVASMIGGALILTASLVVLIRER